MENAPLDIAIFGSTPLAGLLAGLLAGHGKSVCLVGQRHSPYRVPRGLDLAVAPLTRPETWRLLKQLEVETLNLVSNFGGKTAVNRADAWFVAESRASIEALQHVWGMARANGLTAERVADKSLSRAGAAYRFRNVPMLARDALEPQLDAWLDRAGVRRLDADEATLTLQRSGARIDAGGTVVEVGQVVLADDAALLGHLNEARRGDLLAAVEMTALLTEPARPLPAPFVHFLDRGVMLSQPGKAGISALVRAGPDLEGRLGASFAGRLPLRRLGMSHFRGLESRDGAPVIGALKGTKIFMIAGLGAPAAFFAPALARLIAGTPSPQEKAWFAGHDPAKFAQRAAIAEFVPVSEAVA